MSTSSAAILVVDDVPENREYATYEAASVAFNRGDAVLVLTDGFTEAAAPDGQLYDEASVKKYLSKEWQPDGMLDALVSTVRNFEAGQPPSDDVAAFLLSATSGVKT